MHPAQYTSDTICHSMGLPKFVESGWLAPTVRLLLKPSFDPEVCITLTPDFRLSVVALAEKLWRQPGPCLLTAWREIAFVPASFAYQSIRDFGAALAADRELSERRVCIDGMPIACCLLSEHGLEQFACNPYRSAVADLVSAVIRMGWGSCRNARVRNALAACGRYVGLELSRLPEPPLPEVSLIAVLGASDDRTELIRQLQSRGGQAIPGTSSESSGL